MSDLFTTSKKWMAVLAIGMAFGVTGCGGNDDNNRSVPEVITAEPERGAETGENTGATGRHFICSPTAQNSPNIDLEVNLSADGSQAILGTEEGGIIFVRNQEEVAADEGQMISYQRSTSTDGEELKLSEVLVRGASSGEAELGSVKFNCNLVNQ